MKWINDHYGNFLGFITDIGNLQMFFPSANEERRKTGKEGAQFVLEKSTVTKGPKYAGSALMKAIPGNLAVGHQLGLGLATFGGAASGAVEIAGAFMTPFATTAMAQAREACACRK